MGNILKGELYMALQSIISKEYVQLSFKIPFKIYKISTDRVGFSQIWPGGIK